MPVKRRGAKARPHRITPDAIAAFLAADFVALHRALDLALYEPSPLPQSVEALGVDPDNPPRADGTAWAEAWPKVVALQRELIKAAAGA